MEEYDWAASLCYVDESWAFFTSQALDKQWGDDWNDAPYEHNAGTPYESREDEEEQWVVFRVAWKGSFSTPASTYGNSPYSVEMINAGAVAWLTSESWADNKDKGIVCIPAGATLREFKDKLESKGGIVFLPAKEGEYK